MGIKYNDNKISQKSTDAQYPYYNGNQIAQVYYNGNLVWKKYTPLNFTFNNNTVTGYTGTSSSISIPESYSYVTDIDGTKIFIEGSDVSVTAIGDDAFANNTLLQSVTIPSSITVIGARAFQKCYNLTTVSMSTTPTSIGYCAFALTNLECLIPQFYNCTSLGQGCFAFRNLWRWQYSTTSGQTDTMNRYDAIIRRLLATNIGTLTADGYTGYGYIFAIYSPPYTWGHSGGTETMTMNGALGGPYFEQLNSLWHDTSSTTTTTEMRQINWRLSAQGTTLPYNGAFYQYSAFNWTGNSGNIYESNNFSSSTITNYSSHSYSCSHTSVSAGNYITFTYSYTFTSTCLVKGTLITLANGEIKPIEDIKYTDLLKVWNFETGQVDYQYPLMLAESHTNLITRITLEDDSYIEISGVHDIYDPNLHKFVAWGNGNIPDSEVKSHTMLKLIGNEYQILKVKSLETIKKETTCYCCMTGGTITAFANNILVGSVLLNYAGIEKTNSFSKSFANDKQICYTYNKFKEELYDKSNKYSILGLNLHYAHFYNKDVSNLPQLLAPFEIKKPLNIVNNKIQCTIGFLQGDTLTEQIIPEDIVITMPEIADQDKNKWYVVGEYKYLNPGDSYTINYSTIIRAVKGENNDS